MVTITKRLNFLTSWQYLETNRACKTSCQSQDKRAKKTEHFLLSKLNLPLNINAPVFLRSYQCLQSEMDLTLNVNAPAFAPHKQFLLSKIDLKLNNNAPIFMPNEQYLQSKKNLTLSFNAPVFASSKRILHPVLVLSLNISASAFTSKEHSSDCTAKQLECNLFHKSAIIDTCFCSPPVLYVINPKSLAKSHALEQLWCCTSSWNIV